MIAFWDRLDRLRGATTLVIDRPKGSRHPKYPHIVYPLDYGYLAGTAGGDGNEIDVWCGSADLTCLVAIICTVDTLKNDTEIKLLLGCTDKEIELVHRFHNDNQYMSGLLVRRQEQRYRV